jgi:hypothetical protein
MCGEHRLSINMMLWRVKKLVDYLWNFQSFNCMPALFTCYLGGLPVLYTLGCMTCELPCLLVVLGWGGMYNSVCFEVTLT